MIYFGESISLGETIEGLPKNTVVLVGDPRKFTLDESQRPLKPDGTNIWCHWTSGIPEENFKKYKNITTIESLVLSGLEKKVGPDALLQPFIILFDFGNILKADAPLPLQSVTAFLGDGKLPVTETRLSRGGEASFLKGLTDMEIYRVYYFGLVPCMVSGGGLQVIKLAESPIEVTEYLELCTDRGYPVQATDWAKIALVAASIVTTIGLGIQTFQYFALTEAINSGINREAQYKQLISRKAAIDGYILEREKVLKTNLPPGRAWNVVSSLPPSVSIEELSAYGGEQRIRISVQGINSQGSLAQWLVGVGNIPGIKVLPNARLSEADKGLNKLDVEMLAEGNPKK